MKDKIIIFGCASFSKQMRCIILRIFAFQRSGHIQSTQIQRHLFQEARNIVNIFTQVLRMVLWNPVMQFAIALQFQF